MTTPNVEIVMPYGVTVVGDGTNNPKLAAEHPKQMQNFGLTLPPGPCRIAASWEGDEKVGVVVQTNGTRNYRIVGNIPEKSGGGVHVKGCSPSGRSKTTTCTSTDTSSHPAPRALSRFTRSTSSSAPRRGGGVGDRTDYGSSSEAAGRRFGNHAYYPSTRLAFGLRAVARGRFRFGDHLAGACSSRGRSSARHYVCNGANCDRLCGSDVFCGASRSRTDRFRNAAVGVLSILWTAGFKRSAVGSGDPGGCDDLRGVAAAGGGCAK